MLTFFYLITPLHYLKKQTSTQQAETWTRTSHTIPFPSSWACSNEGGDGCFAGIAGIAGVAGCMHTGQEAQGCLWPKSAWLRGQAAQVCVVWRRYRCVCVSFLTPLSLLPLSSFSSLALPVSPLSSLCPLSSQVVASLGLDVKGEDGARLLADLIGEHMCERKQFTEKELPDLRFSPLPRQDEEFLQNGPYIDAKKEGKKGRAKQE
jgi:hypothetical protein